MKRVSLAAMAAVPGLVGGTLAVVAPAAHAAVAHPDAVHQTSKCAAFPNDCTFLDGSSVHVSAVGVYDWTKAGTGYVGYIAPGFKEDSKWRAHAFAHNTSKLYHYSWGGIHCSFPAQTAVFGWANYKVITTPYIGIYGSYYNGDHTCLPKT
jgi:hypothetical protein